MAELLKSARLESKKSFTLPKGATITKKNVSLTVKEIENGFLLTKSYDLEWSDSKGSNHYEYFDKCWYSETNPIEINMPDEKSLADKLD
jgi:hypothetical protein